METVDGHTFGDVSSSTCSLHEYAEQLRHWLNQAYQWQTASYFVPFAFISHGLQQPSVQGTQQTTAEHQFPASHHSPQQQPRSDTNNNNGSTANVPIPGRIFEVPQLTKRIAAELIDFGILFVMKAVITILVLDRWDLIDSELLNLEQLDNLEENYDFALQLTTNLLIIEIIHRFLVIGYEVWFTLRNGSTPGKKIMGIKAIYCTKALAIAPNRVVVDPATQLGFWRATGRATLKNMGTALLFPTFLPFIIVQHNRTLYDVLCGTIVVED